MRFRASELADHLGGRLVGDDVTVDGASIDSRSIRPGQLFVPVAGARDGHDFIADALSAGAAAYLTSRPPVGGNAIAVRDTGAALRSLGALARLRLSGDVIGITGSVGKTTVKEIVRHLLEGSFTAAASERSFNNELGVPLTLANAPEPCDWLVLELGARSVGHIRTLTETAQPLVGVVTTVGMAHLETFGDLDTVARAKAELVQALPSTGVAVLNVDDARVAAMARDCRASVLGYGVSPGAEVRAAEIELDAQACARFTLASPWGSAAVVLGLHGLHQVHNALAAATTALWCGVPLPDVAGRLGEVGGAEMRMQFDRTASGALLIADYYNANPTSTAAALRTLAATAATRRVALLGVMAELGGDAPALHRGIRALGESLGIEVIGYRTTQYGPPAVESTDDALAVLGDLDAGAALLLKGSRVARLEEVASLLAR